MPEAPTTHTVSTGLGGVEVWLFVVVRLTWVLPGEELGEEGVVVGERLASSSGAGWRLSGSSKVGQLVSGLVGLILDVLGNGSCGTEVGQ